MVQLPQTLTELYQRAEALAGMTLAELSEAIHQPMPASFLRDKGWFGQAVEKYLGAESGSKSQPDFVHLGIELKTIPLNDLYQPQETTYVCTVPPLENCLGMLWQDSPVYVKLRHVLWVPYQSSKNIPIAKRKIAVPLLWQPSAEEDQILASDFEELMEQMVVRGLDSINAKTGVYLQVRPKAASSSIKREVLNAAGERVYTVPRGFYLRTCFTAQVLSKFFRQS